MMHDDRSWYSYRALSPLPLPFAYLEEIDALCVAIGNAVGSPWEVSLTSLLRRLEPDHPFLSRLDRLAADYRDGVDAPG